MNVANASLSQMPFHQRIVTRSPNHMCASSWATTSATRLHARSGCSWPGRRAGAALAERDAAEVLHRAGGEVGQRDAGRPCRPGTGCRSTPRTSAGECADVEAEGGEVALARHVDDPQRRAVDVDRLGGLERADDERDEIGATSASCRRNGPDLAAVGVARARLAAVGDRGEAGVDHQRDAEDGLEVGLVPAREGPPASVDSNCVVAMTCSLPSSST